MIHFQNLSNIIRERVRASKKDVLAFSPYMTTNALTSIFDEISNEVHVFLVTTWNVNDIRYGSSDISAFEYSKKKGFQFYLNQRIHLKTYLADNTKLLTGSANLTYKGVGLAKNSNYETMVEIDKCPNDYLCYLLSILNNSVLVNEEIYEYFQSKCKNFIGKKVDDETQEEINQAIFDKKKFLVSELPMSESVGSIFNTITNLDKADDFTKLCAFHDLVKYNMNNYNADSLSEFQEAFSKEFFRHPFIVKLVEFLDESQSFGRVKAWIQSNCTDVPVPNRKELTSNVRILFDWLTELDSKHFEVKRPNYAEVIFKKSKKHGDH